MQEEHIGCLKSTGKAYDIDASEGRSRPAYGGHFFMYASSRPDRMFLILPLRQSMTAIFHCTVYGRRASSVDRQIRDAAAIRGAVVDT